MKKAGKIVIGLVCVGAFGALMFTRFTKKEEPIEAVPNQPSSSRHRRQEILNFPQD